MEQIIQELAFQSDVLHFYCFKFRPFKSGLTSSIMHNADMGMGIWGEEREGEKEGDLRLGEREGDLSINLATNLLLSMTKYIC